MDQGAGLRRGLSTEMKRGGEEKRQTTHASRPTPYGCLSPRTGSAPRPRHRIRHRHEPLVGAGAGTGRRRGREARAGLGFGGRERGEAAGRGEGHGASAGLREERRPGAHTCRYGIFSQSCEMTEMPPAGHRNCTRWHAFLTTIHCSSVCFRSGSPDSPEGRSDGQNRIKKSI